MDRRGLKPQREVPPDTVASLGTPVVQFSNIRRVLKHCAPFAFLVALPFLLHWKLFATNPDERTIFRGDFLNQHFVWKSYALERFKQGELPLWNPQVLGGVAFHANPQVGIFYPPTYLLLPFHSDGQVSYMALEGYQLLHLGLAGVGMFLLLRTLGLGTLGALAAGTISMFTGFFTTPGHHAIVLTAAWIPLVLFFVTQASTKPSLQKTVWLSLPIAAMILAGHPQPAYFGLLVVIAWAVVISSPRRALRFVAPAIILAVGLSAVQWMSTYQLARESSRAEVGYEYATTFEFSTWFLSAAISPRGQLRLPGQDGAAPLHLYVGIGTLLLAAVGVLLAQDRLRLFFAGLAATGFLLSLGSHSTIFDIAYLSVPGFGNFRIPYRLLGLYTFGMAALAGYGLDALDRAHSEIRRHLTSVLQGTFCILLILMGWTAYIHTKVTVSPGFLKPGQVELIASEAYWALILAATSFLLVLIFAWRWQERWALYGLMVLLVIDMGSFVKNRAQHPYRTLVRAGERPVHRFARAQGYRSRHVTDTDLSSYSMLHGTDFAGGQDSLVDMHYAKLLSGSRTSSNTLSILNVKFVDRTMPDKEYPWCGQRYSSPLPLLDVPPEISPANISFPPVKFHTLRLYWQPMDEGGQAQIVLNGKTYLLSGDQTLEIIAEEPQSLDSLLVQVSPDNPGIRIEEIELDLNPIGLLVDYVELDGLKLNIHALPRSYFMVPSNIQSEAASSEVLNCWTTHRPIQVVDPATGKSATGFFRKGATLIKSYTPEKVIIDTRSPRDGYLILSDTFRTGWTASVDGSPETILRAHTAFRGVAVPAGEHRVTFTYEPRALYAGAWVSLLSLIFVIAVPSIGCWRERSTKSSMSTDTHKRPQQTKIPDTSPTQHT